MSVRRFDSTGVAVVAEDYQTPHGGARYAESVARQIDEALLHGGDLAEIAKQFGWNPSEVRAHIKKRVLSGRWRFIATAGRLRPIRGKAE